MNVDLGESDVNVQNTRVVVRVVPVLELRGITNAQGNCSLGVVVPEEVLALRILLISSIT